MTVLTIFFKSLARSRSYTPNTTRMMTSSAISCDHVSADEVAPTGQRADSASAISEIMPS
jgi:hypothetical protein